MARIQSLIQQHSLERAISPTRSSYIGGMSGASEGVPVMHPLKSSMPSFGAGSLLKASSLMHGLRIKKFAMPRIGGMRMPGMKMPGLRLPRV